MNLVTTSIYDHKPQTNFPLIIQYAIIQQLTDAVNTNLGTSTHPRDLPTWRGIDGSIVVGLDAYKVDGCLTDTELGQTIKNWNDCSAIHTVALDPTTQEIVRNIELDMQSSENTQMYLASLDALIPTEVDRMANNSDLVSKCVVDILHDGETNQRLYMQQSPGGKHMIERIRHSLLNNDTGVPDIFIIQAPQGAGKTFVLTQLAEMTTEVNKCITFVSARQQLIKDLVADIKSKTSIDPNKMLVGVSGSKRNQSHTLDHYQVTATTINSFDTTWDFIAELARHDKKIKDQLKKKLITQDEFDQIRRYLDEIRLNDSRYSLMKKQDIVVSDEFQLIKSSLVAGSHIDNNMAYWIRHRMSYLERNARVVIIMDADIDASCVEYFTSNHSRSSVYNYRFIVPETREMHVHPDNQSLLGWLLSEIMLIEPKSGDKLSPASFAIPCTSTIDGRRLFTKIGQMRPDLKIIWIESNNKHESKQSAILTDPSLAYQYDVVLYSPTIFTGFSFDSTWVNNTNLPIASRVVGVFAGDKINWMERAQALFRVRDCPQFHFSLANSMTSESDPELDQQSEDRELRADLFDHDGLRVPMNKVECSNKSMVTYFRSRGFKMFRHDHLDPSEDVIDMAKIKARIRKTVSRGGKSRFDLAREFVEMFLQMWSVNPTVGTHKIFEGRLEQEFSKIMDPVFTPGHPMFNCVLGAYPNWRRTGRYDMRTIQKMFILADRDIEARVQYFNVRPKDGIRYEVHIMSLVVTG